MCRRRLLACTSQLLCEPSAPGSATASRSWSPSRAPAAAPAAAPGLASAAFAVDEQSPCRQPMQVAEGNLPSIAQVEAAPNPPQGCRELYQVPSAPIALPRHRTAITAAAKNPAKPPSLPRVPHMCICTPPWREVGRSPSSWAWCRAAPVPAMCNAAKMLGAPSSRVLCWIRAAHHRPSPYPPPSPLQAKRPQVVGQRPHCPQVVQGAYPPRHPPVQQPTP